VASEIKVKIKIDDDGSLSIVQKEAEKASKATDKLAKSTNTLNNKRGNFHKREKGAAGITSNSTKAFAKQAQTIGGGSSGLVGAYAVLAANVFALSAAFNFFKNAADVSNLEKSQIAYAANTGVALKSVTDRLRNAADGMLGFKEAAQAAGIGLAKGFSPKQLDNMAQAARRASTALGRDFGDSFDRLLRGVSKAEPELLDELGITLRLKTATETYAAALGTTADQLTDTQRSQAIYVETMKQANDLFGGVKPQTNAFIKLSKTFEDLAKAGTQLVLPFFEGFANVLSSNAIAAATVFGAVAISIFKMMVPLDGLTNRFKSYDETQKAALKSTSKNLDEVNQKLRATANQEKRASKIAQNAAKRSGVKSGLVGKLASGDKMSAQQIGQTRAMLKRAEEDYEKHGEIRSKILQKANIKDIKAMRRALDQKVRASKLGHRSMAAHAKRASLVLKKGYLNIKRVGTASFRAIGRAAQFAGKMAGKAMKMAGIIGALMMVWEVAQKIMAAPFSLVKGILSGIDKLINGAIAGFNMIASKIPKWMLPKSMEDGIQMVSNLAEKFESSGVGTYLKGIEDTATATRKAKEEQEAFNETLDTMKEDLDTILGQLREKKGLDKESVKLNAMGTLGLGDALSAAGTDKGKIASVQKKFSGVEGISSGMSKALAAGDLEGVRALETAAQAATSGMRALKDSVANLNQNLKSGDLVQAQIILEGLKREAEGVAKAAGTAGAPGTAAEAMTQFDNAVKGAKEGTDAFLVSLQAHNAAVVQLSVSQAHANFLGTERGKIVKASNELTKAQLELDANLIAIKAAENEQEKTKLENLTKELEIKLKLAEIEKIKSTEGALSGAAAQTNAVLGGMESTGEGNDKKVELKSFSQMADFVSPMNEELAKMGPEGEFMSTAISGFLTLGESMQTAMEGGKISMQEGLSVAATAVTAMSGIFAAQAKAKVAGVDKEIAAEKKRDGKSKASLAKIAQLEKKKDNIKKKAFEKEKKMKMASVIISTAQAVAGSIASSPMTLGMPWAAINLAMGMAQLAAIKSTSYEGGGSAASSGAGAAPSSVSQGERSNSVDLSKSQSAVGELGYARGREGLGNANNFKPAFTGARYRAAGGSTGFMVGEQGPELFMPDTPGTIVPAGDTAAAGGAGSNVSFNISAMDSAGVEDVLIRQRANIIAMIRESANQVGDTFLENVDTASEGASI